MQNANSYDCIVIGGGIGGLTAGIYLARFNFNVAVIDNKQSRASLIPLSHNYPGFPDGISGKEIISRLTEQYKKYHQDLIIDTVIRITKKSNQFFVKTSSSTFVAKKIIIATGVIDVEPDLPNLKECVKTGLIRHCLICDGYEVRNKKVAVIGTNKKGIREALFLKTYSQDVSFINIGKKIFLSNYEKNQIIKNPINIIEEPIKEVIVYNKVISEIKTAKQSYQFETFYSALGFKARTDLAIKLGIRHTKENLLKVNAAQETNIKGVFAIGDIVPGLNQMTVASSQAAIAAVRIFNELKKLF